MFYSNQLLSRKGPFGQIWIAATMHKKINRRKAEQIDIAEICEQILNPVVPLALRLSGILMGGVVLIYNHKVKFFSEDVNNLLIQIKLITATKNLDTTSLPKEKSQARFEAITIEYGFSEEHNELEKEMLRSITIDDTQTAREEKFFYIPDIAAPETKRDSISRFQAEQEKITIQDQLQTEAVVGNEDDRIPPPDDVILDDLCPELLLQDNLPPELNITLEEEVQQSTVHGRKHDQEAAVARSSEGSPEHKKTKMRKRKRRAAVLDTDFTEIPADVLRVWLKQPEDIVKNKKPRIKSCKLAYNSTIERQFTFPSSSLSWNATTGVESTWAPQILELWDMTKFPRKNAASAAAESPEVQRRVRRRTTEGTHQEYEKQNLDRDGPPQGELSLQEAAEILQNIQEGVDQPNFVNYGSIEKLRSALHTPDGNNRDELLINQLGLTPRFSGQSGKTKTALRMSTPSSGRLSLDREVDFPKPTSRMGRSGSIHGDLSPGLELQPDEYLRETIATNFDELGDGDILGNSLSQFVLEETWPSQDPIRPRLQPIDKLTSSFLQVLREGFDQHPKRTISSSELVGRANRSQAAKVFYQICVMASNCFISVEQRKPFGEILLRRGPYL
ncbi:hypothetical protein GOP47_0008959 [Adiantum capillus-veneris]|uniref:Sister chromatid cohesion 1 protein 1 n=1 Tax=Adiantum capillus-veneris TaxID=13818 RepID=A0A9D4UZK6_ADICA|nr:hypothetical protein GOP47_0008310 [Adiantum capillus-veneris]KAI5076894.1 hypothetical protein GOP47_0008959 [Adiantum capillus-veneris]